MAKATVPLPMPSSSSSPASRPAACFRWCDNHDNNNPAVLTSMSKTFAAMVATMAFDTAVMSRPRSTVAPAAATASAPRGANHLTR